MFQFYDLHAYTINKNHRNFLVRPVLDGKNNWAVKYWTALEYRRFRYTDNNVQTCSKDILSNLELSFLTKPYLAGNSNNPLYGFCYLTCQTIFYLLETKHLSPYSGLDDLGNIHYWLKDEITEEIVDPTASQYEQLTCDPPYEKGKKRKWYGFRPFPQLRTLDLIQKIQPDAKRSKVLSLQKLDG